MVVYQQDRRRRLTLVLLVVTSLALISLDERGTAVLDDARGAAQDAVSPIQGVVDDAVNPVSDFLAGFGRADELEAENAKLRRRLAAAQGEVDAASAALAENEKFRQIFDIPAIEDYDSVVATVVSGSADNFHQTWRIDKGSSSGIERDMPVVVGAARGALVGKIVGVASDSAIVQRIDDRSFGVGVQLVRADGPGPIGAARGIPNSRLLSLSLFNDANSGIAIETGQLVVTAGLDSQRYPGGLPVGRVLRSVPATAAVARNTRLEPVVDLDTVDIVKVLRFPAAAGTS